MEAYIYDVVRTVRGKGNRKGALMGTTPTQLLVTLLDKLRERNDFDPKLVEDFICGCVTQVMDQGANIAKTAAQQSGYGDHLCGVSLNRFCGSGLEAINQASAYVKSGFTDLMLAGGVESMSRVKMGADGGAMMMDPAVALKGHSIPQGVSADLIASKFGYSRRMVDEFAAESQRRAAAAEAAGYFAKSRIDVTDENGFVLLNRDENVRAGTTADSLASLKPSFEMMGQMAGFDDIAIQKYPEVAAINHVHHAGNSSAIVDGAAIALIGNKEIGERMGLKPRARIRSVGVVGTDPTMMLVGPAPASRKALKKAGMHKSDIDLYEINEAFASVAMRFMEDLGVDHSITNVNGGAIALGHPLGATGFGGGMGIATIIERV